MARKSNKTSHVLNLLAGEESVPEAGEKEEEKTEPEKSKDKKEAAGDAPEISIVNARNSTDDPLSDLIREQLEENLEQAENPETADQQLSGLQEPAAPLETASDTEEHTTSEASVQAVSEENPEDGAAETITVSQEPPSQEAVSTETGSAEITADEPVSAETEKEDGTAPDEISSEKSAEDPQPDGGAPIIENRDASDSLTDANIDAAAREALPPNHPVVSPDHLNALLYPENADDDSVHYRFINVMEYVVKDMVLDYMKRFGMCTCERCVVDTTALTLTFCSAKYIVVDKHTVSPLLNYYANKYTGDVTVALTRACTMVNENPRH